MRPTLRPGDVVFARLDPHPHPGNVVVFPHPNETDLWLVKRVSAAGAGEAWVESDNPTATMADSRTLGWIPTAEMYRATWRLRPPVWWARL